jgi:hypothetical protein
MNIESGPIVRWLSWSFACYTVGELLRRCQRINRFEVAINIVPLRAASTPHVERPVSVVVTSAFDVRVFCAIEGLRKTQAAEVILVYVLREGKLYLQGHS